MAVITTMVLAGYAVKWTGQAESRLLVADEPAEEYPTGAAIFPLELPANIDVAKAQLGKELFSDTRLSKDNSISCQSCHSFSKGGADGRQFSIGVGGAKGDVNSPTVFNSAFNFTQFWNGRAQDLTAQAPEPVHNPAEMGTSWQEVVEKLSRDPNLSQKFLTIFNRPPDARAIVESIVEFERSLVTLNAPFDRYLRGDSNAITEQQLRGFHKFNNYGCIACHQGQNVGGNMFQTMGVAHDYFKERGGSFPSDLGRFAITKLEADRHVFKVPSLRNVELTAPYFHDGSEPRLDSAVRKMARYQLGRDLPAQDAADIVAFLKSLTGEAPSILQTRDGYGTANK